MKEYQKRETLPGKMKRRKRQKGIQKRVLVFSMLAFLLGVLCGKIVFAEEKVKEENVPENIINEASAEEKININWTRTEHEELQSEEEEPWNLVLVNATHFMEEDYKPELAEIENNYYVDKRIVFYLKQMLADGRKEGLDFWICSAYRTMEKQTQLFENKVQRVMAEEGLSYEEAYEKAGTTVAIPGTSEHQLGLAVDIVAKDYQILDSKQADTAEAKWLEENCWKYGFILRYPLNKTEETGIIFEPWHYRYVGIEAAKEIMEQGICLEEYLDALEDDTL